MTVVERSAPTLRHRVGRRGWEVLGVVAAALATVLIVLAILAVADGWVWAIGIVAVLLALIALVATPVHWLPAVAAIAFCVLPLRLLPSSGAFGAMPPITAIVVVWVVRRLLMTRNDGDGRAWPAFRLWSFVLAAAFAGWLLVTTAQSVSIVTSMGWTVSFCLAVISPMLVGDAREEARILRSALIWCGGIFAAYAVVELMLQSSVYDIIYTAVGASTDRTWSVYRAHSSFGHPLFAASFFTITAVLGVGGWVRGGPTRYLVLGGLSAAGVAATVSRGPIAAMAVGMGLVLLGGLAFHTRFLPRLAALGTLGGIGVLAILNFPALQQREDSVEGVLSAGARDLGTDVALRAAESVGWLGSGPATSGITSRQFDEVIVENSLLQLLISVGVPGVVLFVALFAAVASTALTHRDVGTAAAVAAYVVAISGFNAIDALQQLHVLLGFLVILAFHGGPIEPQSATAVALETPADRTKERHGTGQHR